MIQMRSAVQDGIFMLIRMVDGAPRALMAGAAEPKRLAPALR
jgi:hypothetical protein